jgi:hypothetical protein
MPIKPDPLADLIHDSLDRALRDSLKDIKDLPTMVRIRRRRFFGLGMMITSFFCLAFAVVIRPYKDLSDSYLFIFMGFVVLVLGAWQMDKAAKLEDQALALQEKLFKNKHPAQVIQLFNNDTSEPGNPS